MGRILRNTKKGAAPKSPAKAANKNDCKHCKKSFKSMIQHLRKNKDCQLVYDEMVAKPKGEAGDPMKKECRCCKKAFVSLLKHIHKAKKCKENYGSKGKCNE